MTERIRVEQLNLVMTRWKNVKIGSPEEIEYWTKWISLIKTNKEAKDACRRTLANSKKNMQALKLLEKINKESL